MDLTNRKMPWWYFIMIGLIAIAASIYVLADPSVGLVILTVLVALGAGGYGLFNIAQAVQNRSDKKHFIPLLLHGLIDVVLALLIIIIVDSPNLLGIIVACWLMAFGVFEIVFGRIDGEPKRNRLGAVMFFIGLALLVVPLALGFDYVLLIAIVGLIIGVFCAALGIVMKTKQDRRTSGGRSNLI